MLDKHLSSDYKHKVNVILELIDSIDKQKDVELHFGYMVFPDFIEYFGLDHYEISIRAIEKITQFISCEFAIRPFILKYPEKTMAQMHVWSHHEHPHVRRFSSEGCRPRLPWSMALPFLKKDPSPVLPILERLRNDEAEWVRRSVANHLNDITKDNPEIVIELAKKWKGESKEVDWVIKHACRSLLKQGKSEVMRLFGFGDTKDISILDFTVKTPEVRIGDFLEFSFRLLNKSDQSILLRLEYAIYFQKANGTLSKKVFSISEKKYAASSETAMVRKQSFKLITTRKYHKGLHQVSLIINGVEQKQYDFNLVD
jgi:3-methyladenine DNA glycosylase AlkC